MRSLLSVLLLTCYITLSGYGQSGNLSSVNIEGEVNSPLKFTADDLAKLPLTEAKTVARDGSTRVYTGVALSELLKRSGATMGADLRGENLMKYLLIRSSDGYEVIYALPEVDPEFTDNLVLLAFRMNGGPLPSGEGPFRIVSPAEKRQARWVREVSSIKVVFSKE